MLYNLSQCSSPTCKVMGCTLEYVDCALLLLWLLSVAMGPDTMV
jgi:hypothetical protein